MKKIAIFRSSCTIYLKCIGMHNDARIFVAGHTGLLGSALARKLQNDGYRNIITRTHKELDLTNQLLSFFLLGVYILLQEDGAVLCGCGVR